MLANQITIEQEEPRERHYVMAHHAFRQIAQEDSNYFFSLMASEHQSAFITNVIEQVENNCPDDETEFKAEDFSIVTSRVGNHPVVLIQMPQVKSYAEAVYVGVLSTLDLKKPLEEQTPEILYYTLEIGEGDHGNCFFFCQWTQEAHANLGEIEGECNLEAFATLIEQRHELMSTKGSH